MNRLNWITYLKILYDQLEKTKQPELLDRKSMSSNSFLNNSPLNKQNRIIERVDKSQFMKALSKIMSLLPLMSEVEYNYRYPSDKAIRFNEMENNIMCCQSQYLTWDAIIDILLMINLHSNK